MKTADIGLVCNTLLTNLCLKPDYLCYII